MGRKSSGAARAAERTFGDGEVVALRQVQDDVAAQAIAVRAALGEVVPYNRRATIAGLRGLMAQGAQVMLEIGRMLVEAREHEPADAFASLLNEIGLDPRAARRLMQAALKFSGKALTVPQEKALAQLGRGKLYELLVLDDEEVQALADGGSVAGVTLDAVDRMSTSELRATLRKERSKAAAELEVKQKLIDRKAATIDRLEEENNRLTHGAPDEQQRQAADRERAVITRLTESMMLVMGAIEAYEAAVAACLAEPSERRTHLATETTRYLFRRLADISLERGWLVDFNSAAVPPWLAEALGAASAD